MSTEGVKWGWRVPCSAPGCSEVLERWADHDHGPPVLVNPNPAWALHSVNSNRRHGVVLIGYCPDHSKQAKDWSAAHKAWQDARRDYGRDVWKGLNSFLNTLLPSIAKSRVGEQVRLWSEANPEPLPPWKNLPDEWRS